MKMLQSSDISVLKLRWDSPLVPVTCSTVQMIGPEFGGSETPRFSPARAQHWGTGVVQSLGGWDSPGFSPRAPGCSPSCS